jgi:hypothetical protein
MRSKAYLQFVSLWRALRGRTLAITGGASAKISPILVYTAVLLALLLAILETARYRSELDSIGLARIERLGELGFVGP